MKSFTFLSPFPVLWIFVTVAIGLLWWWRSRSRRRQLSDVFEKGGNLDQRLKEQGTRLAWSQTFKFLGFIFLCGALMRPVWDPVKVGVEQNGRDLIFVLDVSRSMLAKDSRPNRLEVAKAAIEQCLKTKRGDRYALMAFAGSASIRCPLTRDQRFFRKMLREIGPESVAQGGTRIEDALTKVVDKLLLDDSESTARDLILISDGEDLGSQPERSVNKLNALGVRMLVIGLGDADYGERIPNEKGDGFIVYKGKEVWTRHRPDALRALTNLSTQGVFFPVGTGALNLEAILEQLRHTWPGQSREEAERTVYTEGYPYLLAVALCLWFLSICLELKWKSAPKALAVLMVFSLGTAKPSRLEATNIQANVQVTEASIEEPSLKEVSEKLGFEALKQEDWKLAQRHFQALIEKESHARHDFHLGYALYQSENYEAAAHHFELASRNSDERDLVIRSRYNAGCAMIEWGFVLEELWLDPDIDEEELEEMMTPEEVFYRAIEFYRSILWEDTHHKNAAWNLEWLMRYLYSDDENNDDQNSQQQQRQQEGEQENSDDESEGDNEESDEQQEGESDEEGKPSDQNPSGDRSLKMSSLSLPPPAASPEEILAQEQQNQLKREKGKSGERAKVEKDW